MDILKELTWWAGRLISGRKESDTFYMGHHCNMKKIHKPGKLPEHVHFPVSLAVRHGEELPVVYEDFSLNLSRGAAFIETEEPLSEGSELILHFYIPPEKKLLAEFKGEVATANSGPSHPHGMYILLYDWPSNSLQQLEGYLDGHRHLLDRVA